ncbi:unnamed protein product [Polarella glacialis]|uniref:EF-hand domain-containing protein n=1 Tax=Polarella glacialis TaxID=89957 RepID=A0A813EC64_POLGL|nr:unnamed protein product [Polarella glacialis]CAE8707993.1 unnamed protein product [Polarella glacialis]
MARDGSVPPDESGVRPETSAAEVGIVDVGQLPGLEPLAQEDEPQHAPPVEVKTSPRSANPMSPRRSDGSQDPLTPRRRSMKELHLLLGVHGVLNDSKSQKELEKQASLTRSSSFGDTKSTREGKKGKQWSYSIGFSKTFVVVSGVAIILNIFWLGIMADALVRYEKGEIPSLLPYNIIASLFLVWFTFELIVRCVTLHSVGKGFWTEPVILFDIVVVLVPAIQIWILTPLGEEVMILQIISLLRLLRIIRAADIFQRATMFRPLYLAIKSVRFAMPKLIASTMLLAAFMFTAAVALTFLLGPSSTVHDTIPRLVAVRFASVGRTFLTLSEVLFGGMQWGPSLLEPMLGHNETRVAGIFLFVWAIFANLIGLSLFAAIFIQQIASTRNQLGAITEHEEMHICKSLLDLVLESFSDMDEDDNGCLSWEEFSRGMLRHEGIMRDLGVGFTEAKGLFAKLDVDKSGLVSIQEFVVGLQSFLLHKPLEVLIIEHTQGKAQKELTAHHKRVSEDTARLLKYIEHQSEKLDQASLGVERLPEDVRRTLVQKFSQVDDPDISASPRDDSWQEVTTRQLTLRGMSPRSQSSSNWRQEGCASFRSSWLRALDTQGRDRIRRQLRTVDL